MRIDAATAPGTSGHPNEDWVSAALPVQGQGGSLLVLDGVTPPRDGGGCVHGVPWFTARLGGALVELCGSRPELTLRAILARSIRRTADAHRQTCDLSHVRTPQATVALARWGAPDGELEYLVLSDSVLLLQSPGGSVEPVLDDRLDRLPREALRSQASADALRNAEGGFFTAAADPAVAERAVTGSVPRERVRALAALTDGAARWVQMFAEGDWAACMKLLRTEGAHGLIDRVRARESAAAAADSGAPRWKLHDDATAVLAEF
ncbi:protein phosphatase 2C domain-containing protein [Streptomyces sp. NPDC090026]|uniref:protein phosphatase 2C domain-containing protein n=1 Tax=Streptomyces sp. NPDC090026 TaxID=3365923 RepID=UPI00381A626F